MQLVLLFQCLLGNVSPVLRSVELYIETCGRCQGGCRAEIRLQYDVDQNTTAVRNEFTVSVFAYSTVKYQMIWPLVNRFKACEKKQNKIGS